MDYLKKNKKIIGVLFLVIAMVASFLVCININKDIFVVEGLKFNIAVTDSKGKKPVENRIVKVNAGERRKYNIVISLLNSQKANYELLYDICEDEKCKNYVIDDDVEVNTSFLNVSGIIKKDYGRELDIEIRNKSDDDYYIEFKLNSSKKEIALERKIEIKPKRTEPEIIAVVNGSQVPSFPTGQNYAVSVNCEKEDGSASNVVPRIYYDSGWKVDIGNIITTDFLCYANFGALTTYTYNELASLYKCANFDPGVGVNTPIIEYTGNCEIEAGVGLQGSGTEWKLSLISSGTLNITKSIAFDIFLVGGGGAGGAGRNDTGGGGGGGGYTQTFRNVPLASYGPGYSVVIGAGGQNIGDDGSPTTFSTGGAVLTAAGGHAGHSSNILGGNGTTGGDGGSGGGTGVKGARDWEEYAKEGGANGANGISGSASGGIGQGTTTCEFGEVYTGGGSGIYCSGGTAADKTKNLYSGGGGGGESCGWKDTYGGFCEFLSIGASGGAGGGGHGRVGSNYVNDGAANTGGGGGGGAGKGGSGIVVIRNAR